MNALDRIALRQLCDRKQVIYAEGDSWIGILLAIMIIILIYGFLDEMDNRKATEKALGNAVRAAQEAQQATQKDKDVPTIQLKGSGYECRISRVREEWRSVVADECKRVAGVLRLARASE